MTTLEQEIETIRKDLKKATDTWVRQKLLDELRLREAMVFGN